MTDNADCDINIYKHTPTVQKHRKGYVMSGIIARKGLFLVRDIYPVMVNYDLSIESAVQLNHYDEENPDITSENFPTERKGVAEVKVEIVCFDRAISGEDVLRELDKMACHARRRRLLLRAA